MNMKTEPNDMAYPSLGENGLTKREVMAMHLMAASMSTDGNGDAPRLALMQHADEGVRAADCLIETLNYDPESLGDIYLSN